MKKRIIPLCLALVFTLCQLTTLAFALQNESKYLSSYRTDAIARSDGKIAFEASVHGTRIMSRIGILKIDIYEREGGHWISAGGFSDSDDGMIATDAIRYGNTIYFDATPGVYYQIFITIFAEDANGSDSRTEIHYVTARGNTQT